MALECRDQSRNKNLGVKYKRGDYVTPSLEMTATAELVSLNC